MTNSKLFQYAAIWNPNPDQSEKGEKSKLIVDITTCLAKDMKEVSIVASRAIPEEYITQLEQIEIVVKSF